jgi:hypothetical protein
MVSEMSNEGGLSKLKEVDDNDDKNTNGSTQGVQLQSNEAKTIKILAKKNAILRQQQYYNSRIRPRSSITNAYNLGNGYGLEEPVPKKPRWCEEVLPLKTAVKAAVKVSMLLLRCQRRRRSVEAAIEVSKPSWRCRGRVEVSTPPSKC